MKIDLLDYIPETIKSENGKREFSLDIHSDNYYIMISYYNPIPNSKENKNREYCLTIPRFVNKNSETFEVIGLLQAEMGKTNNGMLNFSNCEYKLVNKVIKWFDKELEFGPEKWKWYIKVNLNELQDPEIRKQFEEKMVNHWMNKTDISIENRYPKSVVYVKETKNQRLKRGNYGTLNIERKMNLFSQIIKHLVKKISQQIINLDNNYVRSYLRGIIAGESCIEYSKSEKAYRVSISAIKKEERNLYENCLRKLEISSRQYEYSDKVIVSRRENNIQLLKQKLMCLSPNKYNRFLNMMRLYPKIAEETGYFTGNRKPHNKLPREKIEEVIKIGKENPSWSCRKIAGQAGVSAIKVSRLRKENNLGKRFNKTPEEKIKNIMDTHNKNPSLYAYQIADLTGVHKQVVERLRRKYGLRRVKKSYR